MDTTLSPAKNHALMNKLLNCKDLSLDDRSYIFDFFKQHSLCLSKMNGVFCADDNGMETIEHTHVQRKLFEDIKNVDNNNIEISKESVIENGLKQCNGINGTLKNSDEEKVQQISEESVIENGLKQCNGINGTLIISDKEKAQQNSAEHEKNVGKTNLTKDASFEIDSTELDLMETETIIDNLDNEIMKDFLKKDDRIKEILTLPSEQQNLTELYELSKDTFFIRRAFITSAINCSLKICKDLYPYIFNRDQIFKEFELISHQENFYQKFMHNVDVYKDVILQHAPTSPVCKKIRAKIEMASEDQVSWLKQVGSLLMLPYYMKEERKGLFIFDSEQIVTRHGGKPYIQCTGDINSILDKTATFKLLSGAIEICRPNDIQEAYFGLMAAYCIFNKRYSNHCLNTLILMEQIYTEYSIHPKKLTANLKKQIELLKKYAVEKSEFS